MLNISVPNRSAEYWRSFQINTIKIKVHTLYYTGHILALIWALYKVPIIIRPFFFHTGITKMQRVKRPQQGIFTHYVIKNFTKTVLSCQHPSKMHSDIIFDRNTHHPIPYRLTHTQRKRFSCHHLGTQHNWTRKVMWPL